MPARPRRLTFHRTKGFDLQGTSRALNGLPAKMVTRPGKWGNPFAIKDMAARFQLKPQAAHDKAIELHRQWMEGTLDPALWPGEAPPAIADIRAELSGHNLACWCRQDETCHADLLVVLANPETAA